MLEPPELEFSRAKNDTVMMSEAKRAKDNSIILPEVQVGQRFRTNIIYSKSINL